MTKPEWCVLVSKPMAEEVAEKSARAAGYRTYLPRSSQRIVGTWRDEFGHKHRKRGEIVMRPAFRGYLFVELWPDQQWRDLLDSRKVRGITDMLMSYRGSDTERPRLLSPKLIEALRAAEDEGLFDIPNRLRWRGKSQKRDDLQTGMSVRIADGPFAGFVAKVAQLDDLGRSRLLADIFGRETPLDFDETATAALEIVAA